MPLLIEGTIGAHDAEPAELKLQLKFQN